VKYVWTAGRLRRLPIVGHVSELQINAKPGANTIGPITGTVPCPQALPACTQPQSPYERERVMSTHGAEINHQIRTSLGRQLALTGGVDPWNQPPAGAASGTSDVAD
jgi:hypothetical protein